MENKNGGNFGISICFPRYGEKSDIKLIDIYKQIEKILVIAIYNFTDKNIFKAILEAKDRNISIRVITDRIMILTPMQFFNFRKLKKAVIPTIKNSHPGFMHLKITISDKRS